MLLTYYALRALVHEWDRILPGATIGACYSQTRAELAVALYREEEEHTLFVRLASPLRCMYRRDGYSRARRNVAGILEDAVGGVIEKVRVAERDRFVYIDLENGRSLQIIPFGPRPNVILVSTDGTVSDAFLRASDVQESAAPVPRPAPAVDTPSAFIERWNPKDAALERAVSRAMPLFDRTIAREVLHRATLPPDASPDVAPEVLERIWTAARQLEAEFAAPAPCIYNEQGGPPLFALVPLTHLERAPDERHDTVDHAVERFVRRYLSEHAFQSRFQPLHRALSSEAERLHKRLQRMKTEMSSASRADRYEHFGHVLMAQPHLVPKGMSEATVPDVFQPGKEVRIPLDPQRSAVQNAEAFYEKARQSRAAREHAVRRLDESEAELRRVEDALLDLEETDRVADLKEFENRYADVVDRVTTSGTAIDPEAVRYRTFELAGGYVVLVGKNAAQNDSLTFRHAARHDFWLHARGVSGSHVILRPRGRKDDPPPRIREQAASIAAYYSKAAGSELVPVIITPRKYVRKLKGGPPGAVTFEREDVLIVPPRLPDHE